MKKIFALWLFFLFFISKTIAQNNLPPVLELNSDTVSTVGLDSIQWQKLEDNTNAFYATSEKQKAEGLTQNAEYKPTVSVKTKKVNDKIEVIVKDNGYGIPASIKDKIFQPFFTTKPTGEGTGLGLSLSYDIIKAHGGEIKVETKEGEGSEFIIQLPFKW